MIFRIRFDNIESMVLKEKLPVLVACAHDGDQFGELMKTLEALSTEYDGVLKTCVLHRDSIKAYCDAYDIEGTPTFLIMYQGRERDRLLGYADKKALAAFIKSTLPEVG